MDPDEWHVDFSKLFSAEGIGKSRCSGSDGGISLTHHRLGGHPARHRLQRQIDTFRQAFLQDGQFPFTDVLTEKDLKEALHEIKTPWIDRLFTPLVTLWVFLGQVLAADQSCRAAVDRLIAHRVARGKKPCSLETGAYCQARGRLPERFFAVIAKLVGWRLDERVDPRWLWKARRIYMFDGSTVAMPDTPENRAEYPLTYNQEPGTCFPIARIGAIISRQARRFGSSAARSFGAEADVRD